MANHELYPKIKCFLVCFLIVFLMLGMYLYKPPLKDVTVSELEAIQGIRTGGVIMERVQAYIVCNPNATVEDLRIIKGVDDMIIDQLKERFR